MELFTQKGLKDKAPILIIEFLWSRRVCIDYSLYVILYD